MPHGPPQWPQEIPSRGTLGSTRPYAVDTIEPPFENPWNAPLFFGGHDFLADGTAMLATMQGDVWRVSGIDEGLSADEAMARVEAELQARQNPQ